jgi:hypothetical protein
MLAVPDGGPEGNKMSNKAKVCLAIVAVMAAAVPAGLFLADASTSAQASTTACGSSCASPSVESLGTGDVLTVSGSGVVMSSASSSNSGQDWAVEDEGGVTAAVSAGILSGKLMLNYSDSNLVEFQYAPNGTPSDKCLGDSSALNSASTFYDPSLSVGLVQCGITPASLWIVDQSNAASPYDDLINAGYEASYTYLAPDIGTSPEEGQNPVTSPFAEPYVLTVSSAGAIALAPLSEIGGVVSQTQAWTAYTAPDQSALRAAIKKSAGQLPR